MLKELNTMRRKYQRILKRNNEPLSESISSFISNPSDKVFKRARDVLISETSFELPDCQTLLDNLSSAILDHTLTPDSLDFLFACSLVRKLKSSAQGPVPVSTKELQFFNSSSKEQLVAFITNKDCLTVKHEDFEPRLQ